MYFFSEMLHENNLVQVFVWSFTSQRVLTQSIQDDQGRHEVGMVENTVKTPLGINQEGCLFEAR